MMTDFDIGTHSQDGDFDFKTIAVFLFSKCDREPDLSHFAWIWAILLRFGLYCLDLGYLAEFGSEMMDLRSELGFSVKIWAILLRFGLYCLDLGYLAKFGSE